MATKGKNKRRTIEYDGYEFDSDEEKEFYIWLLDAVLHGLVEPEWTYQPRTFILFDKETYPVERQMKTKVKTIERHLLHGHEYEPDFLIRFTPKMIELINSSDDPCEFGGFKMIQAGKDVWIDIKGTHNRTKRSFSIDQKWVYNHFGIFVNEVVPKNLFKATWCPESLRWTPKKKDPRKHYHDWPVLGDFLNPKVED